MTNPIGKSSWSEAEVDLLKAMHAAGDSFSAIRRALAPLGGKSRNAAISKARRLNLPMRVPENATRTKGDRARAIMAQAAMGLR